MDRNKASEIQIQLREALKPILAQHNLVLSKESGRFDFSTLKISFVLGEADVAKQQKQDALADAGIADGQVFQSHGKTWKVVGIKPGRNFDWVIAERQPDGKRFRFHPHDVPKQN